MKCRLCSSVFRKYKHSSLQFKNAIYAFVSMIYIILISTYHAFVLNCILFVMLLCYALLYYVMLCYAMLCDGALRCVGSRYSMLCHIILCHIILFRVVSCYVM